jgi:hypothetical protein
MLKCKHVADALAEHHHEDLSKWQRIGLRLHMALCFVCCKYHKQVMLMQDCARGLAGRESEDTGSPSDDQRLSDKARERMKASLAED